MVLQGAGWSAESRGFPVDIHWPQRTRRLIIWKDAVFVGGVHGAEGIRDIVFMPTKKPPPFQTAHCRERIAS
jgi:hypothetical protein